jgi:hypothetical protein
MKLEVELKPDIGEALLERAQSATAPERVKAFEEFLAGLETDALLPEETFQRENWYPDRS